MLYHAMQSRGSGGLFLCSFSFASPKENKPKEKGTSRRNFLPMAKTARKLRVATLLNLGAFLAKAQSGPFAKSLHRSDSTRSVLLPEGFGLCPMGCYDVMLSLSKHLLYFASAPAGTFAKSVHRTLFLRSVRWRGHTLQKPAGL